MRFTFLLSILLVVFTSPIFSQISEKFDDEFISDDLELPVGVLIDPEGRVLVWEKGGKVKWVSTEVGVEPITILDISEKVASWADQGLMCVALDPDYAFNRNLYVAYAMDRYYLEHHQDSNYRPDSTVTKQATIGRIARYTMNESFDQVIPDSEHIIIGKSFEDGVSISADFHGLGSIVFGDDGSLLFSVGDGGNDEEDEPDQNHFYADQALEDGIITEKEIVGPYRAQLLDNMNGKILRIHPITGEAYPSNPFYEQDNPSSDRSKVYSLGHRNPFAFVKVPNTGDVIAEMGNPGFLFSGDVGGGAWEELNFIDTAGLNFGWPNFEAYLNQWPYHFQLIKENKDAPNPEGALCDRPYFHFQDLISNELKDGGVPFYPNPCVPEIDISSNTQTFIQRPPVIAWSNSKWNLPERTIVKSLVSNDLVIRDQLAFPLGIVDKDFGGYSSMPGFWYSSGSLPDSMNNSLFVADFSGWIRAFRFDEDYQLIKVTTIKEDVKGIVRMAFHEEEQAIYYVDIEENTLHRLIYDGNPRPIALIEVDKNYGASPFTVSFDGSGSYDPRGENLEYEWDFGDGSKSTSVNPSHVFVNAAGSKAFEVSLKVTDEVGQIAVHKVTVSVNNTPPVVDIAGAKDGDFYTISGRNYIPLKGLAVDNEESNESLIFTWEQFLHHNFHFHPENPVMDSVFTAVTEPLGCKDEDYWYRVRLTVEDSYGLSDVKEINIYPDCQPSDIEISWLPEYLDDNKVLLNWSIPNAEGVCEIERFDYAGNYTLLNSLEVGTGQSGFEYIDNDPLVGINTYRIRNVRNDGRYDYSSMRSVYFPYKPVCQAYPSLSIDKVELSWRASFWEPLAIRVVDIKGALVWEKTWNVDEIPQSYSLDVSPFSPGQYIVLFQVNGETISRQITRI